MEKELLTGIRLEEILAPVDFSPASKAGAAFAAAMAQRFHSRLKFLHVIEPPTLPEWGYAHLSIRDVKLRKEALERFSEFISESGVDAAFAGPLEIESGEPELQICQAAIASHSDLIVMASHGLGGIKHSITGSTAERVVRKAPCPVLTFRERATQVSEASREPLSLKRILVTTDFSELSKKAFTYAMALARRFEATLTLVHVVPAHLPGDLSHVAIVERENQLMAEAEEKLPRFRNAELDPHMRVDSHVLNGDPAHEICRAAEVHEMDLIVISTHGYSGLRRFMLGSVTQGVIRQAPCPVLVVRAEERDFVSVNR